MQIGGHYYFVGQDGTGRSHPIPPTNFRNKSVDKTKGGLTVQICRRISLEAYQVTCTAYP